MNTPPSLRPFTTANTPANRRFVPRLAAYLPKTITRRILSEGVLTPGEGRVLDAATLFTDISGFTVMTETLAEEGPRGAEELNRTLLMTFTPMINAIHMAGGSVCHFHGDAMSVYFVDDDGQASRRAVACGRFLQSLMLPTGRFNLTMKVGVGYGRCLEMVVGDSAKSLEFVLAGTAVNEAVAAQNQAEAGQVIASRAVLEKAGWTSSTPFREVTEIVPVPSASPPFYWNAFQPEVITRLAEIAPRFIHPNLFERLEDENNQFVAEHRPVTSLFVQFMGIDYDAADAPEKLQEYYEWARQIVARYGGDNSRLNRVLTGDKGSQLHILFGAPVAPNSPDQALRCALALQRERPDFISEQRIGLAAGQGFACAVGSQNRREYTAIGRVINLSARLAMLCPNGAVLTNEATANLVQSAIQFEQLPATPVKGFYKPIPLYKATGEKTASQQLQVRFDQWQRPPPGRDIELGVLLEKMDDAIQGQGQLVALTGEPGSGQSQLLAVAVRYWLEMNGTGFMGIAQRQQSDVPFAPWSSVWRDFLGITGDMNLLEQMTAVSDRLQTLNPDITKQEIQTWGDILGLSKVFGNVSTDISNTVVFDFAQQYLIQTAHERPLLIVIEDIHFADQFSLDLLDQLIPKIKKQKILFIVTFRPHASFAFRSLNRSLVTHIRLDDLSTERARQLVKQILGTEQQLPVVVEQRLGMQDRAGRTSPVNPLFLADLLNLMLSEGILTMGGNGRLHIDALKLAQARVPDSIYAFSLAQLDHLSASSRSLLQAAAVIGREFDLQTLAAINLNATKAEIAPFLADLEAQGLIRLTQEEATPTYIFLRALTHNAVYQSLPYARRQSLHASIADWLLAQNKENPAPIYPILAYHYGQTDRHEDGLRFALMAAKDADGRYANKEAAELYELALTHIAALGESEHWQTAAQIYIRRTKVLRRMGQFKQAMLTAADGLKLALVQTDPQMTKVETLPFYTLMGEMRLAQGRHADVLDLTEHVVNSSQNRDADVLAHAHILNGLAKNGLVDYAGTMVEVNQAEEVCRLTQNSHRLVDVSVVKSVAYHDHARLEKALAAAQEAVQLVRQNNHAIQLGVALNLLSQVHLRRGEPEEGLTAVNEAIQATHNLSRNLWARLLTQRAAIYLYLGQLDPVYADLQDAARLLEEMEDILGKIHLHLIWCQFNLSRGDSRAARQQLTDIGEITAVYPLPIHEQIQLWLATGQVALQMQRPDQAQSLFELAVKGINKTKLLWWQPVAYYGLAMSAIAEKKTEQAVHQLQIALGSVRHGGDPDYLSNILLQLALLEEDGKRRNQYLEGAVNAANVRAAYRDRIACFRVAAPLLIQTEDVQLRQLGQRCLQLVEWFDAEVSA